MTPRPFRAAAAVPLLAAAAAQAQFPTDAAGPVPILSNDFPALNAINERARGCATLVNRHGEPDHPTTDHQVPALTANPAEYTVRFGANGSMTALLTAGHLRPMDEYMAKYGQDLQPSQMIEIDGKGMASALMANPGIAPPQTSVEVIAAAQAIRAGGKMPNPFGLASAPGWELGQEKPDLAVWLRMGHVPIPAVKAVIALVKGSAPSCPALPWLTLMHTASDDRIGPFIKGDERAAQAFGDAEAAHTTVARKAGLIRQRRAGWAADPAPSHLCPVHPVPDGNQGRCRHDGRDECRDTAGPVQWLWHLFRRSASCIGGTERDLVRRARCRHRRGADPEPAVPPGPAVHAGLYDRRCRRALAGWLRCRSPSCPAGRAAGSFMSRYCR